MRPLPVYNLFICKGMQYRAAGVLPLGRKTMKNKIRALTVAALLGGAVWLGSTPAEAWFHPGYGYYPGYGYSGYGYYPGYGYPGYGYSGYGYYPGYGYPGWGYFPGWGGGWGGGIGFGFGFGFGGGGWGGPGGWWW